MFELKKSIEICIRWWCKRTSAGNLFKFCCRASKEYQVNLKNTAWLHTNPIVQNSKLSSGLWINKVVCFTCIMVFCRLMLLSSMEDWKDKSERKLKVEVFYVDLDFSSSIEYRAGTKTCCTSTYLRHPIIGLKGTSSKEALFVKLSTVKALEKDWNRTSK